MAHIKVQIEDFDIGAEIAALTAGRTDIGGIGCFVGTGPCGRQGQGIEGHRDDPRALSRDDRAGDHRHR